MNKAQVADFLTAKVGLFKECLSARAAEIVAGSRVASYEAGESILEFGEDAAFLGVVLEGEASLSVLSDAGDRRIMGIFKPGDTFGEIALMTGDKSVADVIAGTRCLILEVPLSLFSSLIMPEPRAVQYVSKTIAARVKQLGESAAKSEEAFHKNPDPYGLRLKGVRPEKILVLNCGSSSLKYGFFDTEDESHDCRGVIECIGTLQARHVFDGARGKVTQDLPGAGHKEAFAAMLQGLTNAESGVLKSLSDVSAVGHRVVHGGERFGEAVVINEEVLTAIESLSPLAPQHNPLNLDGIKEAQKLLPAVPHVAVFDTAFHQTLPSYAYLYGLPFELYEKCNVRRYGFHGTSHAYVCLAAAQHLKRRLNELEIVSCHLGNGASICAVDHGRSVDTSMGFTPLEGLIMGTRCGDLDPGVVTFLERSAGMNAAGIEEMLNKKSGLLGMSGISGDMREVEKAAEEGNHRALLALKAFCYRVRKFIGAYLAVMKGLDVVIFTGGIGQGSAGVRALALQGLSCMGICLDEARNREAGGDQIVRISTDDSPVSVLVVPTNEERMMARETLRALSRSYIIRVMETQRREPIPIEVSAHHVHLAEEHVKKLFGPGYQLSWHSDLSQPGQFACREQVNLLGPKGRVERVRVLGPARKSTQIEISMTEQFKLGIHPPIRESGDIKGTPGCTLEGPAGTVTIDEGVICALRHIHMTPQDALRYGVKDRSRVRVRVAGNRELVFGDVLVRVDPSYKLSMHIDTDEGNAGAIQTGAQGYIDWIQSQD